MRSLRTRMLSATVSLAAAATLGVASAGPALADYPDPAYVEHDADNMARAHGRQVAQGTDAEYGEAFVGAGADTFLSDLGQTANDARAGRIYTGGGRYIPGGSAGDPRHYYDVQSTEVSFVSRTGAKLTGHVWGGTASTRGESLAQRPGVVITSGSIQGYEAMYFWAARELARRGYIVLTFDVQGQGRSEGVGHAPASSTPTFAGVPFQQEANFVDGTVDALEFMLSTPSDEYLPSARLGATNPWTPEAREAQKAASEGREELDWVNPFWAELDRDTIGLAGHSLGASSISIVQQCSDVADLWDPAVAGDAVVPECGGQSYPIRAVVGWDGLSASRGSAPIQPLVPGMNQQADGYFFNVTPAFTAPAADGHLGVHRAWQAAGQDTYSFTVRGGTHLEWTDLPYILPATTYGTSMATSYTGAWMDRFLWPDTTVQAEALDFLLTAPATTDCSSMVAGTNMSLRYEGGFSLTTRPQVDRRALETIATESLRTFGEGNPWAGVGEWAEGNAEC